MKKRINRISILQSSKIVTVLSALSGFIYTLIGIPMFASGRDIMKDIGLFYIAGPVWMAVFGFVFFVIFAAIYNLLARRLGGIEVELNDE